MSSFIALDYLRSFLVGLKPVAMLHQPRLGKVVLQQLWISGYPELGGGDEPEVH